LHAAETVKENDREGPSDIGSIRLRQSSRASLIMPDRRKSSRDDRTAIELFLSGLQGWEASLQQLAGGLADAK
jgi:hypothetical protein